MVHVWIESFEQNASNTQLQAAYISLIRSKHLYSHWYKSELFDVLQYNLALVLQRLFCNTSYQGGLITTPVTVNLKMKPPDTYNKISKLDNGISPGFWHKEISNGDSKLCNLQLRLKMWIHPLPVSTIFFSRLTVNWGEPNLFRQLPWPQRM